MNLHRRVERALGHAPLVNGFVESTNDLTMYTDKGDDYPVLLNMHGYRGGPNEVFVDTRMPDGLRKLYMAYGDVTGTPLSEEEIEYTQRHEGQHLDAAKYLGATSAVFGIRMYRVQRGELEIVDTVQPLTAVLKLRTTKLGAALISAYPLPPSNGDNIDVASYGYSDVVQLAEKAMRRNASRKRPDQEQFWPVPLSSQFQSYF